jgi:hypothetical protein
VKLPEDLLALMELSLLPMDHCLIEKSATVNAEIFYAFYSTKFSIVILEIHLARH